MTTLECFGGVAIRDDGGAQLSLRSRKHVGLLLYLAANPSTQYSRTDLALLLWDGVDSRARHSLSQALYDIRTTIGEVLTVDTRTVALRSGSIECEAIRLEKAVQNGDHEAALRLYRGEFAPNLRDLGVEEFDRWIDMERERFRVLAALGLRNAQHAAEVYGNWDEMCLAALRLIRENDLDEDAHAALMRGLWMKGDPASALLHAESLRTRTPDEARPLVEALAARIELSGTHSEVLSVPRTHSPLLEREEGYAELIRAIRVPRPGGHIAIISGDRGIGKTSLLFEVARRVELDGMKVKWVGRHGLASPARATTGRRPHTDSKIVYFVDTTDAVELDLDVVIEWVSERDALAYATASTFRTSRELAECGRITVTHLPPLTPRGIVTAMRRRFPRLGHPVLETVTQLSGGNPGLAVAMCRSWEPDFKSLSQDPAKVGDELLSRRNPLTVMLDDWLADLDPGEWNVAAILAQATDESLAILERHLTVRERRALARLRRRGWVRRVGSPKVSPRILKRALEVRSSREGALELRRKLAARLESGEERDRYAAALEYERGGVAERAREVAMVVAKDALKGGNSALATAASEVACRTALTGTDRFDAGLLLAESALRRGSAGEAAAVLRTLEGVAPSPAAAFDVSIKLGRAALAEGTIDEAVRQLDGKDPVRCAPKEPIAATRGAVELAQLRLDLAVLQHSPSHVALSRKLESEIGRARSLAPMLPVTWADAVRTLFAYYLSETSRASARAMLARHGDTLLQLGESGRTVLASCNAVLEMRSGRLQTAEQILRDVVDRRSAADRLCAVSLNNLAVVLMESGMFKQANAHLDETVELDRVVGLPARDRVTAYMNRAQCAFFSGEQHAADANCTAVLKIARQHRLRALEAEALAISGLMARQTGCHEKAAQLAGRIADLVPDMPTDADGYFVEWFVGVYKLSGEKLGAYLREAAQRYEPLDRLASAKLRLLAAALGSERRSTFEGAGEAGQALRSSGCGWFVSFAQSYQDEAWRGRGRS